MKKPKILIVDDIKINIIALAQILESQYEIVVANNGKSALEIAERYKPDLILLDIVMPNMTGFELLLKLKNSALTRDIPVIFITGLDNVEDEEKGLLLGAVDYITKPFHKSIIKARIGTHLQMSRYVRTIERLCMIDALTELSNRRGLDQRIALEWGRAVREQTVISVLMIDIDWFKIYNDTYGHPQGDRLLKAVADVFNRNLRRASDFAARWGGEEFLLLLPNTPLSGAMMIAEQIREEIQNMTVPCSDDGMKTSTTVSIGVHSMIPSAADAASDFIAMADKALYTAKSEGRNRTCAYQT